MYISKHLQWNWYSTSEVILFIFGASEVRSSLHHMQRVYCKMLTILLYAALGLKLLSNRRGLEPERHESYGYVSEVLCLEW